MVDIYSQYFYTDKMNRDFKRGIFSLSGVLILSLFLSACEEGHSFSNRYRYGMPVENDKTAPRPVTPKDKPKAPVKKVATNSNNKFFAPSNKPPGNKPKALQASMIKVKKGDTLYALARRHDVTMRSIIHANGLKPPYLLNVGQRLKMKAVAHYRVKKGDTLYSLSRKHHVDMPQLVRINGLKKPYLLTIGQQVKVPTNGNPGKKVRPKKSHFTYAPPPPRSAKGFLWPVKGSIISGYGPKATGHHNDGINIAARSGSYVGAAESGVVVHVGNKIKGFGNLILVKHQNGWITAYGHNADILVKKGQTVKRGQAIARVGQTGSATRPQLHFEMRKGARAVNPVSYLKS